MENKTPKKRIPLSEKLRNAIGNIHVDVFGFEKNTTRNIHNYFDRLSQETGMPKDQIIVRIFRYGAFIRVCVHRAGKPIRDIPVSQLVMLFTNTDPSAMPHLREKAVTGIERFMTEYSSQHQVHLSTLHICILTSGDQVIIKGLQGTEEIGTIPLSVLIKHFTR